MNLCSAPRGRLATGMRCSVLQRPDLKLALERATLLVLDMKLRGAGRLGRCGLGGMVGGGRGRGAWKSTKDVRRVGKPVSMRMKKAGGRRAPAHATTAAHAKAMPAGCNTTKTGGTTHPDSVPLL